MTEFTEKEIKYLIENHNWELAALGGETYLLQQKNKHYMKTDEFELQKEIGDRFLSKQDK